MKIFQTVYKQVEILNNVKNTNCASINWFGVVQH